LVFWLAVGSDVADGWVARRYGEVTRLGGVIDHAADATFVSVGCLALAHIGVLPVALALLIVLAFLQYAADSRVVSTQRLRPSRIGRWNGIAYYVIVAVPIMRDALGLGWPTPGWVLALGWLLVAATLLSMLDRFRWFVLGRRARGSRA
jgi:phosphatidylglycerophosphate synthase